MQHTQKKGTLVNAQYLILWLLFFAPNLFAALPFNLFDCTLSGYIKGETYTDSRRTLSDEVDEISYFPLEQIDDPEGHDINAQASMNMDAFETRICGDFSGLKMGEASLSGKIEVDFEIFYNPVTNVPHMRHAYGKLDWKNFSFLFGHTWHPVVYMEPPTINYNGPSPFDYYARAPQFSCTYHTSKNCDLIATVISETDYTSDGPYGFITEYMRWAKIPNLHLQSRWFLNDHLTGIGIDYKRIAPRIVSNTGFKVHERLSSFAIIWYLRLKWSSFEMNAKINGGQNTTEYGSIGGYAVVRDSTNPITNERKYTNTNNVSLWLDFAIIKNKKIQPGIFIGFAQNLGSHKEIEFDTVDKNGKVIEQKVFGFVPRVNNVFRITPRITSVIYNVTFAGEVEYTSAAYGTLTRYAKAINTKPAELVRCTFGAYYFF